MNSKAGFVLVLLVTTILPKQQVDALDPSDLIQAVIQVTTTLVSIVEPIISSLSDELKDELSGPLGDLIDVLNKLIDTLKSSGLLDDAKKKKKAKKKKAKKEE